MTYAQARKKISARRVLGSVLWLLTFLAWLLVSMRIIDASPFSLRRIREAIIWLYDHVPLFPIAWHYTPLIRGEASTSSLVTIGVILAAFTLAGLLFHSARVRAARLRRIDDQIENELIWESLRPGNKRSMIEIRQMIEMPEPSRWEFFHQKYLAPLVIQLIAAVVAAAIIFWLGWN